MMLNRIKMYWRILTGENLKMPFTRRIKIAYNLFRICSFKKGNLEVFRILPETEEQKEIIFARLSTPWGKYEKNII